MKTFFVCLAFLAVHSSAAFAQTGIRAVDFKNFTYVVTSLSGEDEERITVRDGTFSRESEEDRFYFGVTDIAFGDLNGDGREEAVVGVVVNTGGTGNFSSGIIYTMKGKTPTVVAEFVGGDRADGGLVDVSVEKGLLVVERNAPGINSGACCPEFIDTTRYRLTGKKLVQVGKTTRRDIYPAERVTFKAGSTLKTFLVKLDKYERKRFVVGARKGQTLLFSSTADPVTTVAYDVVRGEGDIEAEPNGLIVKLKSNGDYVLEIASDTDQPIEVSVTIEIK